jgi:hypothetical protein
LETFGKNGERWPSTSGSLIQVKQTILKMPTIMMEDQEP